LQRKFGFGAGKRFHQRFPDKNFAETVTFGGLRFFIGKDFFAMRGRYGIFGLPLNRSMVSLRI
jgi:hypothetical protein